MRDKKARRPAASTPGRKVKTRLNRVQQTLTEFNKVHFFGRRFEVIEPVQDPRAVFRPPSSGFIGIYRGSSELNFFFGGRKCVIEPVPDPRAG